jgi:hypothetical protein
MASSSTYGVLPDWGRFSKIRRKHPFVIEKPQIDPRRLQLIKNAIRRRKKREAILEKEFEEMKQKLVLDPRLDNSSIQQASSNKDEELQSGKNLEEDDLQRQGSLPPLVHFIVHLICYFFLN